MDKLTKIKNSIIEIVGTKPNLPIVAVVKSVENDYCSIELKSGLVLTDVKLKATINGGNYLLVIPKVGSKVIAFSLSGELDNLVVIKVDEVERLEYKQNGLEVVIDSSDQKVSIKNSSVSLIDVLTDLTGALKQLKVFTNVGPSGTPLPDTILALTEFEIKINQLLK